MSDKYLLIKDDCDGDGESTLVYCMFGDYEDVYDAMRRDYGYERTFPAVHYADTGSVSWTGYGMDENAAWLYATGLGYDRHIEWTLINMEGMKRFILMRADVADGSMQVGVYDSYDTLECACQDMRNLYADELVKCSSYRLDEWDPEYSSIDNTAAELTVETRDAALYLNLLDMEDAQPYLGFEYAG